MARGYASVDGIPSVLRAYTRMFMAAARWPGPLFVFVLWTMVTGVLPGSGEGGW